MNAKGYCYISGEQHHWITFLCKALALQFILAFMELFLGVILARAGYLTAPFDAG
jgi:hypothetical protein